MRFIEKPTDEFPEGSECPVHNRVHNSHGWYVCIEEPVMIRTIRPDKMGTVTTLPASSQGIHPLYSETYIRKIRFAEDDPIGIWMENNERTNT